ncbi:hypothetical protein A6R70_22300 [Agrobacterium rubi]|nr:hypothetical protein [Agrobacterium rubi]
MAYYREPISTGKRQKYVHLKKTRKTSAEAAARRVYSVMEQWLERLCWQAIDAPTLTRWKLLLGFTTKAAKDMAKIAISTTIIVKRRTRIVMSIPLFVMVFPHLEHDIATMGLNRR